MFLTKIKKKLGIIYFIAFFLIIGNKTGIANSLEQFSDIHNSWAEKGVAFEAAYIGEYFVNTKGGTKRDDTYLGNVDVTLTFDTEKMQLWDNGTLLVYLLDNHGGQKLTGEFVGDLQTVSNIEAPRTTRLYELWYEHIFFDEKLTVLLGIHDFNSEFNVTEYGGLYINSSFGIQPDISGGARPSIFPLAAPAVRFKVTPNETWEFLLGVYDGDPDDPEDVEHFPRSDFDSDGGAFIASEIAFNFSEDVLPGFVKAGVWHNTGQFNDVVDIDPSGNAIKRDGNTGGYLVIDKMIYSEQKEQGLGVFLQFGANNKNVNEVKMYIGGGFNYYGLIPGRDNDECGIAVAHAIITDDIADNSGRDDYETTLEVTYNAQIKENIRVQPDFQYVINPGAVSGVENAFVAGIRFEITL